MANPHIGAVATATANTTSGGSPRSASISIGEATSGQHRALIVWADTRNGTRALVGMTAGGAAMQALGAGGAGTDTQLTPWITINPTTNGSGAVSLSFICEGGTGEYDPTYWWVVVDDVAASNPYTDLTADGAATGSSNAPSSGSQTVPAGALLVVGMAQYFAGTYSLTGTGSTEHLHGSYLSRPYAIASRTTTGAIAWSASSSNSWRANAVLFAGDGGGASGPTINTQPSNQFAVAPATATFNVAATASGGTLTYQWQHEPAAGGGFSNISGATASSYTTGATSVSGGWHSNGDKYRCAVADANGTTNSSQAVLTVTAAPSGPAITAQPSGQSVIAPAAATFSVAATTSGGVLSYQWQRQSSDGGSYTNISGASSSSYTTGATSVTGGGHRHGDAYRCNVTDSNGTTTSSAATLVVSAASGSITTEAMVNNTGTPQTNRPVHWSWLPAGRIGALASVTPLDGAGTSDAGGRLTVSGLPTGAGILMVAVRGATVVDDAVYWQPGVVA